MSFISGCSPLPAPAVTVQADQVDASPPDAAYGPAERAIPALILVEREASIAKNLAVLSTLWREDAQIIDGRNTADPADDYAWRGRAAILDRYVLAVFPNPPPPLDKAPQPEISVDGQEAIAVNGVDRWRFTQKDGRWQMAELIYLQP